MTIETNEQPNIVTLTEEEITGACNLLLFDIFKLLDKTQVQGKPVPYVVAVAALSQALYAVAENAGFKSSKVSDYVNSLFSALDERNRSEIVTN